MTARAYFPFHEIAVVPGLLSLGDVIFSVAAAFLLTRIILRLSGRDGRDFDVVNLSDAAKAVMERCYALFPNEEIYFGGVVFRRGMLVKITTLRDKTFEGRLLGINDDNVICVLTNKKIKPELLDNVSDIREIPRG